MARTWVGLLHSIVLDGGRRLRNDDLVALADFLGYKRPRPLLATGNLVFEGDAPDARAIEAAMEPAIAARLGRRIDVVVRAADRWSDLIQGNPFAAAAEVAPSRVAVRVMRAPAPTDLLTRLEPYRSPGEELALVAGDLWLHLPFGTAGSRLASAVTPARAGVGTLRNWNTIRRIGQMLD